MTNETLTTILIVLLSINFVLWIAFLIFVLVQIRRIFKVIFGILDDIEDFSSSIIGSAFKVAPLVLGFLKSFQAVKSITTLKDSGDSEDRNKKED
ncbi:hypothetical protein GF360_01675 [candidate division WWE3 bacterium]|nr:hypothetical protein [candidate division WWE3 bacterium]